MIRFTGGLCNCIFVVDVGPDGTGFDRRRLAADNAALLLIMINFYIKTINININVTNSLFLNCFRTLLFCLLYFSLFLLFVSNLFFLLLSHYFHFNYFVTFIVV